MLFERKLTDSREKAQRLIMAGLVLVDGKKETKPGTKFDENVKTEILELPKYVSRGAEKLEKAYQEFKIDFKNKVVTDIGSSTGGFTDFVLQHGAKKVYAIDVGRGQLDWKLRNDPRVVVMEGVNFRYLESLPEGVDIFLIDVSFISVRKVLKKIKDIRYLILDIKEKINKKYSISSIQYPEIILLFKPQFEAGKNIVDKTKGVIKDPKIHEKLLSEFRKWCGENGFGILGEVESPILGAKGNKEWLFFLRIR